ncbi:MAG: hypothetical protein HYX41_02445 [Bdellovibrio sp.]|nr:hypothetical protein [Bdellovibrio sp.]
MKYLINSKTGLNTKKLQAKKNAALHFGISVLTFLLSVSAMGAAKAPPVSSCPGNPNMGTPVPVRAAVLRPVGTQIFSLPNNGQANIGSDLQVLMTSAVAESAAFAPTDPQATYPCGEHIELRAAVSTFQLDLVNLGISIGYTPNGNMGPVTGVSGTAAVKVGTIAMDFSIWSCNSKGCSAIGASTSNHSVASGSLSFNLNFGDISTGPSLMINSPLGKIFRAIMKDGISKLSQSARINDLPWQATVREVSPVGSFIFDAGTQDRIGVNQTFIVYAPTDATTTGVCNVFEAVATAHSVAVGTVSSTALIDSALSSRNVQVGDIVMVRSIR